MQEEIKEIKTVTITEKGQICIPITARNLDGFKEGSKISIIVYNNKVELRPLKKEKMNEWWTKHFDLLIKSGLNKKHLERVINEGKIQFREGVPEFLNFLHKNEIGYQKKMKKHGKICKGRCCCFAISIYRSV